MLILTTNRPGELDEAFRSRVHVTLRYGDLSQEDTKKVWELNLRKVKQSKAKGEMDIDIDEASIREFYEELWDGTPKNKGQRWNGRQIKNAFQSAVAMANWKHHHDPANTEAESERPMLSRKQFDFVAHITADFDKYLNSVHKASDRVGAYAQQAVDGHFRNDAFENNAYDTPSPKSRGANPAASRSGLSPEVEAEIARFKRQIESIKKRNNMTEDQKASKIADLEFEIEERGGTIDDTTAGAPDPRAKKTLW